MDETTSSPINGKQISKNTYGLNDPANEMIRSYETSRIRINTDFMCSLLKFAIVGGIIAVIVGGIATLFGGIVGALISLILLIILLVWLLCILSAAKNQRKQLDAEEAEELEKLE